MWRGTPLDMARLPAATGNLFGLPPLRWCWLLLRLGSGLQMGGLESIISGDFRVESQALEVEEPFQISPFLRMRWSGK